ncbi:hypothetical protein AGMMS49532_10250 [Endomicrobiia bacterium]|nr:hypothetical protein AGMMS49532_10250 [Endomicrobiia bacterium]
MTVMKFKKIFAVILMLSVFLSGCQRQVITGVSKNENDVSTSTNTPAPEPTPAPTPTSTPMPTSTPAPEPTSTPMPTSTPAPEPTPPLTPASPEPASQGTLKKIALFCPPLTQLMFIYGLGLVESAIQESLPYLFSSPTIISTLSIMVANMPIVGAMWFALFAYRSEVSTLSNVLDWSLPALFVFGEFMYFCGVGEVSPFSHWLGVIDPDYFA